jgi:signal transduction histidine kinase
MTTQTRASGALVVAPVGGGTDDTLVGSRQPGLPVSEFSIALALCLITVAGVTLVLADTPLDARSISLPIFVAGAGVMFGLGLTDISRGGELRFGRALLIAGFLWSLSALTASDGSVAYSVGHVSLWLAQLAAAYLLLSYPSGVLRNRPQRMLFLGAALIAGLLFLPTVLVGQFPHPSPWSTCISTCPRNVFSLRTSTPPLVAHVVYPVREVLLVGLFATIAVAVMRRAQRTRPLLGTFYAPLAVAAIVQTVAFIVFFALRVAAPSSTVVSVFSWIFVLSIPVIGLVCGAGRLDRRVQTATALERMARTLRDNANPVEIRRALAGALKDPTLRILHSFPGETRAWVDESGAPVEPTDAAPTQRITEVSGGNWRIAIVHDASLAESRGLVQTTGSYALARLEMSRLTDELRDSLRDLAESRASRLTAEQDARQKIERDLHDGAQQRLVALRVKLGLAASVLADRDPASAEILHALEGDVDATIDEVRALARGIYPPLLARTGLRDALRSASRGAGLPTTVRADGLDRYGADIETTVYFACSEGLQNAVKHARSATRVTISVWQDERLHFEVRDDGGGFDLANTPYGTGLSNLSHRLSAVSGTITIQSSPGQGTVLAGTIPFPVTVPAGAHQASSRSF